VASPTAAPKATAATLDLRTVNWRQFLARDPDLGHPNDPAPPGWQGGESISARVPGTSETIIGYPYVQSVDYVDLDGDGMVEAVISVYSGGTAGTVGALVYGVRNGQPKLLDAIAGYKMGVSVENGRLVVSQVIGAGWEPNCCWSGQVRTAYSMQNGRVVAGQSTETGVPEARPLTIEEFYQRLNNRQFREAYRFLSPAFQQREPFDRWQAGYANLVSVEVSASDTAAGQPVPVQLTVVNRQPNGQLQTVRFRGTWSLIYSTQQHQWLLDTANIAQVN
jgi:hypothetical protein